MKSASRLILPAILSMLSASAALSVQAQEMYDMSIPTEGEVLKEVPKPFVITFSEGIQLQNIRLVAADGSAKPTDWAKVEEDVFKVEFNSKEPLAPGKYSIEWTAYVRQHYHSDGGVINFTYEPAAK